MCHFFLKLLLFRAHHLGASIFGTEQVTRRFFKKIMRVHFRQTFNLIVLIIDQLVTENMTEDVRVSDWLR